MIAGVKLEHAFLLLRNDELFRDAGNAHGDNVRLYFYAHTSVDDLHARIVAQLPTDQHWGDYTIYVPGPGCVPLLFSNRVRRSVHVSVLLLLTSVRKGNVQLRRGDHPVRDPAYRKEFVLSTSNVEAPHVGETTISRQIRTTLPWLMGVITVIAVMGVVILAIHFGTHIDVELLLADPAEKAHLPGYTGTYTYAGSFALLVAGAVCLFTALLLKGRAGVFPPVSFYLWLGVLVAWLGIDDLFMFHEWAGLGIAEVLGRGDEPGARSKLETVVFAGYIVAWFSWISRYREIIRKTAYLLLLLSLVCFGLSLSVDVGTFVFPDLVPDTAWMPTTLAVIEELFKLTGILFAFAYAWKTSMGAARRMLDRADSPTEMPYAR